MPYSLIDYYAGQMAAHFGRLPPRPGGFRPGGFRRPGGGFRRPGGGFRRPFRRPFAPRRGPWLGPGPAPVYYETEPLCTDEWGTPIPCEPVAMNYPEPASTIDMSDVWSQQDEDELEGELGALEEDTDNDGMGGAFRRGPQGHRRAAAKLDARSQWLESEAERLRAAGRPGKAARLEKRAHRADIRSDWQAAQATADQARRDARQALRRGSSALDDTHEVWTQDDEEDLEAMLAMPNESEQVGALDDTHEVWSQDDEEDLEAMLADGEATAPMGSACACGDVGI